MKKSGNAQVLSSFVDLGNGGKPHFLPRLVIFPLQIYLVDLDITQGHFNRFMSQKFLNCFGKPPALLGDS